MATSLKGVARKYLDIEEEFSVVDSLFDGSLSGCVSVHSKLVSIARQNHSFKIRECIYGWKAAYEQIWSHIVVRIKLNPDSGISDSTMNTLKNTWKNAIETTWSNRWGVGVSSESICPITFEVQWVNTNQHHTVRVRQGSERSNMNTWDTQDTGATAAHEFGHMLGLVDEYPDKECSGRSPINTGTIMDNKSNVIPARMMTQFANNIGSNVVAI